MLLHLHFGKVVHRERAHLLDCDCIESLEMGLLGGDLNRLIMVLGREKISSYKNIVQENLL